VILVVAIGLDRTVVSIVHCGCTDPGSIPGLDKFPFCMLVLLASFSSYCSRILIQQ
jgi:hypothetical protein